MDYLKTIAEMSPEVYTRLLRAVETGRWPDGRALTSGQRESALQAVIAYGELHLEATERVGFIDRGHKAGDTCDDPETVPLTFKDEENTGG